MRQPTKWEALLMDTLWDKVAPHVLEIFMEAAQGRSAGCVQIKYCTNIDLDNFTLYSLLYCTL